MSEEQSLVELRRKASLGARVAVDFSGPVPFERLHENGWGVLGIPKGEATLPLTNVSVVLVAAAIGRYGYRPDYADSLAGQSLSGALNYISRTLMDDPDCAQAWGEGSRFALAANKLQQATTYAVSALKRDPWEPAALDTAKKLGIKNPNENATVRDKLEAWVRRYRNKMVGPVLDVGGDHAFRSWLDAQGMRMTMDISAARKPDIVANIEDLSDVSDNSFGIVLCTEMLEYLQRPELALKELWRATRPGGRIFISTAAFSPYNPQPQDYRRFTQAGLVNIMTQTGWLVEESSGIPLPPAIAAQLLDVSTKLYGARLPNPELLGYSTWLAIGRRP